MILEEDGYTKVTDERALAAGDLVVYRDTEGHPTHVGVIMEIVADLSSGQRGFKVLSKWGADGEYLHDIGRVPPLLGKVSDFFSERRLVQ